MGRAKRTEESGLSGAMTRRGFLVATAATAAGLYGLSFLSRRGKVWSSPKRLKRSNLPNHVVVAHGDDPAAATKAAVEEALGNVSKLISIGDNVVIKPNMAWDRTPQQAANTNPLVVAALTEICLAAGARRVKVFDRTCNSDPRRTYDRSGIAAAAKEAGATVEFVDERRFHELRIPQGKALKSWSFYEDILDCDVLINVPIAKHHSTSRLTMGLKNVFGMIGGDRGELHQDIHQNIADLNTVVRCDLTVIDAYRILTDHGPTGGRLEDVEAPHKIIVSTDPVAADSYAATLFGLAGEDLGFVVRSHEHGLGEIDFRENGLKEITT